MPASSREFLARKRCRLPTVQPLPPRKPDCSAISWTDANNSSRCVRWKKPCGQHQRSTRPRKSLSHATSPGLTRRSTLSESRTGPPHCRERRVEGDRPDPPIHPGHRCPNRAHADRPTARTLLGEGRPQGHRPAWSGCSPDRQRQWQDRGAALHIVGGHVNKSGNVLYMAALSAVRYNPVGKALYARYSWPKENRPRRVARSPWPTNCLTIANAMVHNRTPWRHLNVAECP